MISYYNIAIKPEKQTRRSRTAHFSPAMEKTIRQQIIELLQTEELTVRDLSQTLSIMEKEVFKHLEHVARTIRHRGQHLHITPYTCQDCGYAFADRSRLTKPGRCPRCKKSHIRTPRFSIR